MASQTPIAVRFLGLVPTIQGFDKNLTRELTGSRIKGIADSGGTSIGNRMMSSMGKALKRTAVGVGVAAGGVLAASIVKGFGRLSAIENAEAKLRGLGKSADEISLIMESSLKSVQGTAFGLDQAAGLSATLVASGIKPGKDLERTLRLVGDSATISGRSLEDMGLIWTQVASKGKLQGEEAMQIMESGIPIWQMIGDEMGVTAAEAQKLGSDGKVSFEIFRNAMEKNIGGAALESGNTTVGAFRNMGAALSRFGATLLKGVFPLIGPFFNQITGLLDGAAAAVEPFLNRINPLLESAATRLLGYSSAFTDSIGGMLEVLKTGDFNPANWAEGIEEDSALVGFVFTLRDAFLSASGAVTTVRNAISSVDWSPFTSFIGPIVDGMSDLVPVLVQAWTNLSPLATVFEILRPVLPEIGAAIGQLATVLAGILGSALQAVLPAVSQLIGALGPMVAQLLSHVLPAVLDVASGLSTALIPVIRALGPLVSTVISELVPIFQRVVAVVGPLVSMLAERLAPVLVVIGAGIGAVIRFLTPVIGILIRFAPLILGIVAAVVAYNRVMGVVRLVTLAAALANTSLLGAVSAATLGVVRQRVATIASNVAQKAQLFWTKAVTAAQWLFNRALMANPIGLIITAVLALGAGLYLFFTKTEIGRKLWEKIWGAIKAAAAAVAEWFMNTALPILQAAWDGIASGALWLYHNAILPAWNGIRTAIYAVAYWIVNTAWPWIKAAWDAIAAAAVWLYQNVLKPVWDGIRIAIAFVVAAVMTYVELWVYFFRTVVAPLFTWLYQNVILPVWNAIQTAIAAVVEWFRNTAWPFIQATVTLIQIRFEQFKAALQIAWKFIQFYVIQPVIAWFQNTALPFIRNTIALIQLRFEQFKLGLQIIWNFVKNSIINPVIAWFQNTALPFVRNTINLIQMRFDQFKLGLAIIWAFIRNNVIQPVISWFQNTAYPTFQRVIQSIKDRFTDFKNGLKIIWDTVRNNIIQPVVSWFQNTVQPAISTVTDKIKNSFSAMKDGIKTAWDGVKTVARTPVEFVINKVYNEGLKDNFNNVAQKIGLSTRLPHMSLPSGFRSGGILPGQSRMRDGDDQLVPMRRGEGVLVSEALPSKRDKELFLSANAAGRSGTSFSSWLERVSGQRGYLGGGIVDWIKDTGGDAIDWIQDTAGLAADLFSDPKAALKKLLDTFVSAIPGSGIVKDFAIKAPQRLMDSLGDKIASTFTAPAASGGGGVPVYGGPGGRGGSLGAAEALARSMGLRITSRGRRGARTAQNGLVSLHALGRAIDVAGPNMMGYFNAVDRTMNPTELLYSPAGARNKHRSGRRYPNTGATLRNHYSHVHVGFNRGGVFEPLRPILHDAGGRLKPGVSLIANKTGRPETILPPAESRALTTLAKRGGSTGPTYNFGDVHGVDADDLERTIETKRRRRERLYAGL